MSLAHHPQHMSSHASGSAPADQSALNARPSSSRRGAAPYRALALVSCAVGYGLNSVWCILMGHTPEFMASIAGSGLTVNTRLFYLAGVLAFALLCMVLPGQTRRADGVLRFVLPVVGATGALCFMLPANNMLAPFVPTALVGLFLTGIAFFWIAIRYVLLLARAEGATAVIGCVTGGLVIKVALAEAFNDIPSFSLHIVCALAALFASSALFEIACAMMRRTAGVAAAKGSAADSIPSIPHIRTIFGVPQNENILCREPGQASHGERIQMYLLLIVAGVVLAVARSISNLGLWGEASAISNSSPWLVGVIIPAAFVIAFSYLALVRTARLPLAIRFQPALLLVMAGLFAMAIQANPSGTDVAVLSVIIQVSELFAHLTLWTITATAFTVLDLPSYRTASLGWAIYAAASIGWIVCLAGAPVILTLVVMLALYVGIIGLLYLIGTLPGSPGHPTYDSLSRPEGSHDRAPNSTEKDQGLEQPAPARPLIDRCRKLAETYGLSPRETEVLELVVQGRSYAVIQDELGLSGSTVKTHMSHIYAKTETSGRQELFDLMWSVDGPRQ